MPSPNRRPPVRLPALLLAAAAGLAGCASHHAAPRSGSTPTYRKLLATPIAAGDLPAGVTGGAPVRADPNATDRAYHVVGEVDVRLHGPDPVDMIEYVVFRSAADATADLAGGLRQDPRDHVTVAGRPAAGFDVPAHLYTVQVVVGGQPKGYYAHCAAIDGPVIAVGTAAASPANPTGDSTTACALAHAALTHLRALR
ncbi:MAG: hypothetical protein ACJ73S_13570 [Mycobacteriales bacterium]